MVAPGAGFGCTFFVPKIGENPKQKGLRLKISEFLVQIRMGTKQSEKRKVFPTNRWSYGFTSYCGVTPKWWHPGRAASPSDATDVLYCSFLCNRHVRVCRLGDRASFPGSGPQSFRSLSPERYCLQFHIEAYYLLCVSFCTKIKQSINVQRI